MCVRRRAIEGEERQGASVNLSDFQKGLLTSSYLLLCLLPDCDLLTFLGQLFNDFRIKYQICSSEFPVGNFLLFQQLASNHLFINTIFWVLLFANWGTWRIVAVFGKLVIHLKRFVSTERWRLHLQFQDYCFEDEYFAYFCCCNAFFPPFTYLYMHFITLGQIFKNGCILDSLLLHLCTYVAWELFCQ